MRAGIVQFSPSKLILGATKPSVVVGILRLTVVTSQIVPGSQGTGSGGLWLLNRQVRGVWSSSALRL